MGSNLKNQQSFFVAGQPNTYPGTRPIGTNAHRQITQTERGRGEDDYVSTQDGIAAGYRPVSAVTPQDECTVGVVGLGYVGLGLAHLLCRQHHAVRGFDINRERIDTLSAARSPITELSNSDVDFMLSSGFLASDSPEVLSLCDVLVFAVPTPVTQDFSPNLEPLLGGLVTAGQARRKKQLWVIESTIAPGMIDQQILPTLASHGLTHGEDFLLALSPERINPGSKDASISKVPKIVAGVTIEARDAAATFYETAGFPVVLAGSVDEAASAKLLENTYRAVNTALINELAPLFSEHGINPHEVVRLASTKPFGFQAFWPGPGVGGHCIPVDPWYLVHSLGGGFTENTVTTTALKANLAMPEKLTERIVAILENMASVPGDTPAVLLCGMSYKANVGDFRDSPGPQVARALQARGVVVGYQDPFLEQPLSDLNEATWEDQLPLPDAAAYNIVIILQNHDQYRDLSTAWNPTPVLSAAGSSELFAPAIWSEGKEDLVSREGPNNQPERREQVAPQPPQTVAQSYSR